MNNPVFIRKILSHTTDNVKDLFEYAKVSENFEDTVFNHYPHDKIDAKQLIEYAKIDPVKASYLFGNIIRNSNQKFTKCNFFRLFSSFIKHGTEDTLRVVEETKTKINMNDIYLCWIAIKEENYEYFLLKKRAIIMDKGVWDPKRKPIINFKNSPNIIESLLKIASKASDFNFFKEVLTDVTVDFNENDLSHYSRYFIENSNIDACIYFIEYYLKKKNLIFGNIADKINLPDITYHETTTKPKAKDKINFNILFIYFYFGDLTPKHLINYFQDLSKARRNMIKFYLLDHKNNYDFYFSFLDIFNEDRDMINFFTVNCLKTNAEIVEAIDKQPKLYRFVGLRKIYDDENPDNIFSKFLDCVKSSGQDVNYISFSIIDKYPHLMKKLCNLYNTYWFKYSELEKSFYNDSEADFSLLLDKMTTKAIITSESMSRNKLHLMEKREYSILSEQI